MLTQLINQTILSKLAVDVNYPRHFFVVVDAGKKTCVDLTDWSISFVFVSLTPVYWPCLQKSFVDAVLVDCSNLCVVGSSNVMSDDHCGNLIFAP